MEKDFEKQLVEGFDFRFEFDRQKFTRFLSKAGLDLDSIEEQTLYELRCGKLVNNKFVINSAGVLFFAVKPQKFFSETYVTCARYQGNSMVSVVDRKDLEGDLISLVDEAEAFVKRHTRLAYLFDGFKRIDIQEYPYNAIREAIINAVCHRNYLEENNVFVNVFDDRVEVISPGSIPNNLSIKEVYGKSVPRNNTITSLFKKIGYIEKLGSGLKKMQELMMVHGLKKPLYEANKAFFTVTFLGPKDKILDLVQPSSEVDLREQGLNKRQIKALNELQKTRIITSIEYSKNFKVDKRTALRDLTSLVKTGYLKKEGKRKAALYKLALSEKQ